MWILSEKCFFSSPLVFTACHPIFLSFFFFSLIKQSCCWTTHMCEHPPPPPPLPSSVPFSPSAVERISLCLSAWNNDHCSGEIHFHISGDKSDQSASRGFKQLPVAYCGANRKVCSQQPHCCSIQPCTSSRNTHQYLSPLPGPSFTPKWYGKLHS